MSSLNSISKDSLCSLQFFQRVQTSQSLRSGIALSLFVVSILIALFEIPGLLGMVRVITLPGACAMVAVGALGGTGVLISSIWLMIELVTTCNKEASSALDPLPVENKEHKSEPEVLKPVTLRLNEPRPIGMQTKHAKEAAMKNFASGQYGVAHLNGGFFFVDIVCYKNDEETIETKAFTHPNEAYLWANSQDYEPFLGLWDIYVSSSSTS